MINRRFFLRAAGMTLALPLLESLSPRALGAGLALGSQPGAAVGAARPQRMVCIGNMLGFYQPEFFPKGTGRGYDLPLLLQPLAPHQDDFTLFSGLDHGVKGGHFAIHAYLSGILSQNAKSLPDGNITLDQRAAETIKGATRFQSLAIGSEGGLHGGCMMSWTRSGVRVPPIPGPKELYQKLFVNDTESEAGHAKDRLDLQYSILDAVQGDAKSLERQLGKRDQEKLDEYFTAVRDVERQLDLGKSWSKLPKPAPRMAEPQDTNLVSDLPVIYDLIALALQTDSTRIATLEIAGGYESSAFGIRKDYHSLSHHGQVPEKIHDLLTLEKYQTEQFARFLAKMKSIQDGDGTLLDHTMVLFGSGMGNASSHTNNNLPIIVAGGGFKHGECKALSRERSGSPAALQSLSQHAPALRGRRESLWPEHGNARGARLNDEFRTANDEGAEANADRRILTDMRRPDSGFRWAAFSPRIGVLALVLSLLVRTAFADVTKPEPVQDFLGHYCTECHGAEKQKGDRRFDQLALPVAKVETLIDLQDVIDELNLGEMPPKKARQPGEQEARETIALLTKMVEEAQAKLASTGGQTILRRLNRREYLNTVGDLFGLNMAMFDPTSKFPRDQVVQHLDNNGDALKTSGYLLEQYLAAADQVVEKAFAQAERPPERTWDFKDSFQPQPELRYVHQRAFQNRYLCVYETATADNFEGAYAPVEEFSEGVPVDGYYEIKVKAEAMNRKNPYDPEIFGMDPDAPFRLGIVPGDRKTGLLHLPQPIEPQLGEVVVPDGDPEWYTFKVWLDAGFTPRFTFPNGMLETRTTWGKIYSRYKNLFPPDMQHIGGIVETRWVVMQYGQMPHIRIHEVQIRGPIVEAWPPAGQQSILGDRPFAPERTREILERFATRAYRRPARNDEVDRLMAVAESRRRQGRTPFDAMKDALKAALCSPAFLYLSEPEAIDPKNRTLDPYALATRLSYFLWSTMPDDELLRLAQSGELTKPDVLVAQTRRLLASPRSEAFVAGFLDSWLNLRTLGDMAPDRGAFRNYYAQNLQSAMKRETQLFTRNLIDHNLSIVQFLDADYTFANRPLARLYGMEDAVEPAQAHEFHKVTFKTPERGGLLGQGSVLTVSANGVETSPVIRGVWLLENILGAPTPPPPDNVPPIDPDVRGATSMRETLAKHRTSATCAECHKKIDPLGFALESFDPIGAWRAQDEKGKPIDTSGELPDGHSFKDVADLKKILVEHKDQFTRMLTERVLGYACGRQIEPLDRLEVNHLARELADRGYGFRDLVELAVLSKIFQSK